jgi:hypothetical protein
MKFALIWLLILATAYAHEQLDQTCEHNSLSFLQTLHNWFSSQDQEISEAPCKTKIIPSREEMEKFINSDFRIMTDTQINGVVLKNEKSELINAFRDFTTARSMLGERLTPLRQLNIQQTFKINPDCDKVLCALEKIWGKEAAIKMLYIKLSTNFNTSELAFNQSRRFRDEELNDIILAFEDLPKHLRKIGLGKNQRLTAFDGESLSQYGDEKVTANAVIMLFPGWAQKSSFNRQYILFHELSHNISSYLKKLDESPDWLDFSQWVRKDDDWRALEKTSCFISEYAKRNPWEDFAETLSAYRYNGQMLKMRCPEKYSFMKERVFLGIEYLDPASCRVSID